MTGGKRNDFVTAERSARTVEEVANLVGGRVAGDGSFVVKGINSLDEAGEEELSFLIDSRYRSKVNTTRAGALIVREEIQGFSGPQIVAEDPAVAYIGAAALFAPKPPRMQGVHQGAVISPSARIGRNAVVYPFVYIGEDVAVGDGTVLYPGVYLGDRVEVGEDTVLYPNVSVLHDCMVGSRVIIHAGSVIGADGFGFIQAKGRNVKIPQIGRVQIEDEVEIGANSTIDRAALGTTLIRRGVKTDNLVQIGHNVEVGEDTVIVAQTGISGSVKVGRGVMIGGQVGIRDHVTIGDRAMIGAQSGVARSVDPGEVVSGTPSMPHKLWLRTSGLLTKLPSLYERVRKIEARLERMAKRLGPDD
jgi:UDP-3-O-[3-hydroxymyristoyl] glucosamine N-acyltransferase